MIKEYIDELILENNEKLNDLELQLKKLINDLNCATEWMEVLQKEANADTNIFSPRTIDENLKNKTEDAQEKIEKIKQEMEYVKSFIETHLKKKCEYEKLLIELDELIARKQENSFSNTASFDDMNTNKSMLTLDSLSDLYRKAELCLDLLYKDRLKCKNELKEMRSRIKKIIESTSENH